MADTIKTATGRVHALLDAAMAAFAAGAVGFAGFVMPAGIVVPGGQVGRAAISLGAALATFFGVLLLLRAVGGPTRLRKSGSLRLRRADMHPDAPARSPILAARELGVPLDELALDAHTAEAIDLEAAEDDAEREHAPPGFTPAEGGMPATAEALPKNGLPFWIADDAPPEVAEVAAGPAPYQNTSAGCHSLDADRVGPRHRNVVGRAVAGVPTYTYSPALKDLGGVWTPARLDQWLRDTQKMAPGSRMYLQMDDPAQRRQIVTYLQAVSKPKT